MISRSSFTSILKNIFPKGPRLNRVANPGNLWRQPGASGAGKTAGGVGSQQGTLGGAAERSETPAVAGDALVNVLR